STVFGAVRETNVVWTLGDIGVGLMAWVNVVTLLILCPKAIRALKDYETRLRNGESEPVYRPDASEKGTGAWKSE
ncbi:MAG: alanine:cation symporter family protein, partial [Bacteroidales bacterium]|nr:alanine:cation symporter family protein [Bacteroidales bacterium]